MMMRRLVRLVVAGLAALGLAGCGITSFRLPGAPVNEGVYTALYPTYAEICAVSQIDKIPGYGADIRGGVGGHSVLYLNGACLDGGQYPVLRRCKAAEGPEAGVGISANAHFRNANWVGIPGRDLFLHGGLKPGEPLTRIAYQRAQAEAKRLAVLDGITFHDEVFADKPASASERDYKYEVSIATDYAIDFGRGRYCARLPVTTAQLDRIIEFLNAQNAIYADGKRDFEWSVLQDNCSHLTHNALAAAGVWPEWPTEQFILFAAFDFPVPKNEFVNLMRRTNDMAVDDLAAIYADPVSRGQVLRGEWVAARPGAIAEAAPARTPNDLYHTDLKLIFYDEAITGYYRRSLDTIEAEPRYHDVTENLRYFADLYEGIAARRQSLDWWRQHEPRLAAAPDFAAFYRRSYAGVARQAVRADAGLARIAALSGAGRLASLAPAAGYATRMGW